MSVNNIDKILQYIEPISKSPITIDGVIHDKQASKIFLSTSFMLGDGCNMCGKCCVNENNVYTESEYVKILNCLDTEYSKLGLDYTDNKYLIDTITEEHHTVNEKDVTLYVHKNKPQVLDIPDRGTIKRCEWLRQITDTKFVCGIHPVTSITCVMPHLRFYHNRLHDNLYIGTMQYGRNWALKCDVTFDSSVIDLKLSKLEHLKRVCEDLGIETYIDDIIDVAKSLNAYNYSNILGKYDIKSRDKKGAKLF